MDYNLRKTLEKNLGFLAFITMMGMGVKHCIYIPIIKYEGITNSQKEGIDFLSGYIADRNSDGILSKEERRVRDNFYEECKNNFFEIGFACNFPMRNWGSELEGIFSCMKEKYKPKEKFLI